MANIRDKVVNEVDVVKNTVKAIGQQLAKLVTRVSALPKDQKEEKQFIQELAAEKKENRSAS